MIYEERVFRCCFGGEVTLEKEIALAGAGATLEQVAINAVMRAQREGKLRPTSRARDVACLHRVLSESDEDEDEHPLDEAQQAALEEHLEKPVDESAPAEGEPDRERLTPLERIEQVMGGSFESLLTVVPPEHIETLAANPQALWETVEHLHQKFDLVVARLREGLNALLEISKSEDDSRLFWSIVELELARRVAQGAQKEES